MLNINKEKLGLDTKVYGFKMSKDNTIEYLEDAVGKAPAHMNYETGKFDWGDWNEDEFFIPRPCLFANDKFQCYLDINNILRKDNGDIPDCFNNTNSIFEYYMHFGGDKKLYYAYIDDEDGGTEYVYFSNNQVHHNFIPVDFYWGMFPNDINNHSCYGSKIEHIALHTYGVREIYSYASKKIGDMENLILNHLLMLLTKTKDYDKAYGNLKDYDEIIEPVTTGIKTGDKGLFWGNNESIRKLFGIEFYYRHKIPDATKALSTYYTS